MSCLQVFWVTQAQACTIPDCVIEGDQNNNDEDEDEDEDDGRKTGDNVKKVGEKVVGGIIDESKEEDDNDDDGPQKRRS